MTFIIPMMTNVMEVVEQTVRRLLREGEADLVRDARPAFEASELDESQWSAWVDAWIHEAYEQHALDPQNHPRSHLPRKRWCL